MITIKEVRKHLYTLEIFKGLWVFSVTTMEVQWQFYALGMFFIYLF